MPQLDAYLFFQGNCAEAMHFYEKALGGRIDAMMTYAGSPAEKDTPPDWGDKTLHARMVIDGHTLMASDSPPERGAGPMSGFSLSLNYKTTEEARRAFDALAEGGQVHMPLGPTFWAAAFGMLADRFGTPWMIGCEEPPPA